MCHIKTEYQESDADSGKRTPNDGQQVDPEPVEKKIPAAEFSLEIVQSRNWIFHLYNQHAISIGEESVALLHGLSIGFHDELLAGKGTDEHDKRALGQVEVGE